MRANTFVPLENSVPIAEKAAPPLRMIHATFANVSTLLMFDGLSTNPFSAGNGGFSRGMPRLPSSDSMSAVSSPQTNAPAPALMRSSHEKPDPRMFLPRRFAAVASRMAFSSRTIASGYSARTYTNALEAPIAYAAMSIPSMSECGSPSMTARSMNAPGSPSSALQIRYFSVPADLRAAFHLNHVGNPAPPRPARPDTLISSITCSGVIASPPSLPRILAMAR